MKRLIIEHGGRVVHHELGSEPVTIGRDPECDLYFSDQRLSRKHCRVQVTAEGLLFEDLGSRNGSYLDAKRVDVVTLLPHQSVRLGGLVLGWEDDEPLEAVPEGEDQTVVLGAEEDKTVMLSSPPPEHTPRLVETHARETPKEATPERIEPEVEDKTVMLPREPVPQAKPGLVKTQLLDAKSLGQDVDKGADDTMLLPREPAPTPPKPVHANRAGPARRSRGPGEPLPDDDDTAMGGLASSWTAKLLFLVSGVALAVYVTLAFPLVRTLGSALREESLRRGRTLLMLAAASNENAVGEGRVRDASVDMVLREERVKEALLLDLEGNVLAPSSRADETLASIDGIDAELGDIRTFYLGRRGSDYVMVQPMLHRSRRVGFAVLVYEAASASASWATAVLFLSFLVLMLGVLIALVVGKRVTLEPVAGFRDDVEAVVKGDADYVPVRQGFSELSALAKSVNRLIARSFTVSPTPAAAVSPPPAARRPETGPARRAPTSSRRPVTAAVRVEPDPGAARFWVDENYIVSRADDEAAELVGGSVSGMEGKHLIEAVAEQKLLEAILDAVNALAELEAAETTAELPGGTLHITATKDMGSTVVALRRV